MGVSRLPPTNQVSAVLHRGIPGLALAVEDLTEVIVFFDIDGFSAPKFKCKTQILLQIIAKRTFSLTLCYFYYVILACVEVPEGEEFEGPWERPRRPQRRRPKGQQ